MIGKVDLHYVRGDSFAKAMVWEVKDGDRIETDDWEVLAQIRSHADASEVAAVIAVTTSDDPDLPSFVLRMTPEQTAGLPVVAVWDMQLTKGDVVRTICGGDVLQTKDVSR